MNIFLMRNVTSPTQPLVIPEQRKKQYETAVKQHRNGRPEPFEDLVVTVLEMMANEREVARRRRRRQDKGP